MWTVFYIPLSFQPNKLLWCEHRKAICCAFSFPWSYDAGLNEKSLQSSFVQPSTQCCWAPFSTSQPTPRWSECSRWRTVSIPATGHIMACSPKPSLENNPLQMTDPRSLEAQQGIPWFWYLQRVCLPWTRFCPPFSCAREGSESLPTHSLQL